MSEKDLKINFRYLTGNIACISVDSIDGKPVHNDINNEEAIIIFNSLVGEKENCQTVKTLLKENQELKKQLTTYQILHSDCKVDNLKNISKIEEKGIEELNYRLDYDTYDKCKYDIDKVMTLIRPILKNKDKINELVREVIKLKEK